MKKYSLFLYSLIVFTGVAAYSEQLPPEWINYFRFEMTVPEGNPEIMEELHTEEEFSIFTSQQCANIAGKWRYSTNAFATCTAADETIKIPIRQTGSMIINQNGCNIGWSASGYPRTGTINGNDLSVSGQFIDVKSFQGISVTFSSNKLILNGKVDGNKIPLSGIGKASGILYYEGEAYQLTCTGQDKTTLTRPIAFFELSNTHDAKTSKIGLNIFGITKSNVHRFLMPGSLVNFDATKSAGSSGGIKYYEWGIENSIAVRLSDPVYCRIFRNAGLYNISLRVIDDEGVSDEESHNLRIKSLKKGDLIFIRTGGYETLFDLAAETYTHVGMYIGDGKVIESTKDPVPAGSGKNGKGVHITPLSRWGYPTETFATVYRVDVDQEIRDKACEFAQSKVGLPYDKKIIARQLNGNSYYCSELVWAAYYSACKMNLGRTLPTTGVHPDHIAKDQRLFFVSGHWECYPNLLHSCNPIRFPCEQ